MIPISGYHLTFRCFVACSYMYNQCSLCSDNVDLLITCVCVCLERGYVTLVAGA